MEVTGSVQTLICAGQGSISKDGKPLHVGDMKAQLTLAIGNLEAILNQAAYDWADVVRLTVYIVDFDQFLPHYGPLEAKLANTDPNLSLI